MATLNEASATETPATVGIERLFIMVSMLTFFRLKVTKIAL